MKAKITNALDYALKKAGKWFPVPVTVQEHVERSLDAFTKVGLTVGWQPDRNLFSLSGKGQRLAEVVVRDGLIYWSVTQAGSDEPVVGIAESTEEFDRVFGEQMGGWL